MKTGNYLLKNKKMITCYSIMIIIAIAVLIFVCNDYFLYKQDIVTVTAVTEEQTGSTSSTLGDSENEYTQRLTAVVKNGEYKGKEVTISNIYSASQVTDEKYTVGDDLFVSVSGENNKLKVTVTGIKRDFYFAFSILLFVVAIVIVGRKKGALSVASVLFNIVVFGLVIDLYFKGINLFVLCCIACILFSVVSLTLVSGFNRKTLAAVISTLAGTAVTIILAEIVLKVTGGSGVRFEQMEYLIRPYEVIFISELLVGGLGAIMDISITMSASVAELIEKDNSISLSALKKSGREIGNDIMGTMVNVLFFTYVCGCIPLIVLALRNDTSFSDVMHNYISLEIVRSLVGSIGIVITIPIATYISVSMLRKPFSSDKTAVNTDERTE